MTTAELPTLVDGRWRLDAVLGQGSFGVTWRGHDTRLRRDVAIKELRLPGQVPAAERDAWRRRFVAEAEALARFTHAGIVRVYELVEDRGTAFVVMELLEGPTLAAVLRAAGGTLPWAEAVVVGRRVGEALAVMHGHGLLHRDVKPGNIIATLDGRIVLVDLGAARPYAEEAPATSLRLLTPGYAPLEQYGDGHGSAGGPGPHSDVYALAATVYELVTGRRPVAAPDRAAGALLVPASAVDPALPAELSAALVWGLSLIPSDRPASMAVFLTALEAATASAGPDRPLPVGLGTLADDAPTVAVVTAAFAAHPGLKVTVAEPALDPPTEGAPLRWEPTVALGRRRGLFDQDAASGEPVEAGSVRMLASDGRSGDNGIGAPGGASRSGPADWDQPAAALGPQDCPWPVSTGSAFMAAAGSEAATDPTAPAPPMRHGPDAAGLLSRDVEAAGPVPASPPPFRAEGRVLASDRPASRVAGSAGAPPAFEWDDDPHPGGGSGPDAALPVPVRPGSALRLLPAAAVVGAAGSVAPLATLVLLAIGVLPLVNALSAARAHLHSRREGRGRRWHDRIVVPALFPARWLQSVLIGVRVALVPALAGVVLSMAAGRDVLEFGGGGARQGWSAAATLAALAWQLLWLGRSPSYGRRFTVAVRRVPSSGLGWLVALLLAAAAIGAAALLGPLPGLAPTFRSG